MRSRLLITVLLVISMGCASYTLPSGTTVKVRGDAMATVETCKRIVETFDIETDKVITREKEGCESIEIIGGKMSEGLTGTIIQGLQIFVSVFTLGRSF